MISPVVPIYKSGLRKQTYQDAAYLSNKKTKESFEEILDKEISKKTGSNISMKA